MASADAQDVAQTGITVAGRTFRPVTSFAFEQYNWVVSALAQVEVDGIDDPRELLVRVAEAGMGSTLLAGLLNEVKDGEVVEWSPVHAKAVRRFFAGRSDVVECSALQLHLAKELPAFFPGVVASWLSSRISSASESPTPPTSADTTNETTTPSATSDGSSEPLLTAV